MINLRESITAIRLARSIVQQEGPVSVRTARVYLELCCRSEGSPVPSESYSSTLARLKRSTQPAVPMALSCSVLVFAVSSHSKAILLFIPAFIFAAALAWLHRQALDRIEFLSHEEEA